MHRIRLRIRVLTCPCTCILEVQKHTVRRDAVATRGKPLLPSPTLLQRYCSAAKAKKTKDSAKANNTKAKKQTKAKQTKKSTEVVEGQEPRKLRQRVDK